MEKKMIKNVKKGEFFTLKDYGEYPSETVVYVREDYDRETRKYGAYKWADVNRYGEFKPTREVYVGFTF